jgi:hypothetical protein
MKMLWSMFLVLVCSVGLYADTPFILTGIKKAYPVVEIHNDYISKKYKAIIMKKLKAKMKQLGISYKGYPQRSLAFLVTGMPIGDKAVHMRLLIGEEVKRADGEEVFATTYANERVFEIYDVKQDINYYVDDLLNTFAQQYKEDNE